jgi:hypothetical protein
MSHLLWLKDPNILGSAVLSVWQQILHLKISVKTKLIFFSISLAPPLFTLFQVDGSQQPTTK